MSTFSLFTGSYTIIQGDIYHIDGSQRTTNMDSFNVTTTLAGQPSAPESPLESSTPRAPFNDVSSPSADTMPHQRTGGILQTESAARRTSTSSSMSVEDVYPPSRVFNQDLNFPRAAYPYSNRSTDSLEAPESVSARIRNSPAQQKMCQCVLNKLKGWLNRFLGCL